MRMMTPMDLLLILKNMLSFYAYPILCFDISPIAGALAAGCFLLGAAVHSFLLWRRKRAAWFPDLCVTGIAVPFLLIFLSDALDRLIDQRKFDIPLIHQNPLIHSNLGLYVMIFSVAVFYVLLGTILAWVLWRLWQIFIRFSRKDS